jgi:orotidine 5'-phosphate decarboxylase subfamily 2
MSEADFSVRLAASVDRQQSLLAVRIAPPLQLPFRRALSRSQVNELAHWCCRLIAATQPYVCAYLLESACFEALGETGEQLRRAIRSATPPTIPLIWDARRSDVGGAAALYAQACFEHWGMDAVTLTPLAGADSLRPYAAFPHRGVFVLCATANATANTVQALEISDWQTLDREPNQPLSVHLARNSVAGSTDWPAMSRPQCGCHCTAWRAR